MRRRTRGGMRAGGSFTADAEGRNRARKLTRLVLQRFGRGRALFHQRGVLLCHLVKLRDGAVELADARALFGCGSADLADDVGHTLHAGNNLAHRVAGVLHQARTRLDLLDAGADEGLDLTRGFRAALRQAAHFAGHDGKAAALLAGAGRFDSGIQGQDVGLEGDAVNGADDVGDALGAAVDLVHGADHLGHHAAAARCHFAGRTCQLVGGACRIGRLVDGARQCGHRTGRLLQVARGLFGAVAQVCIAGGDFLRRHGHPVGTAPDRAQRLAQPCLQRLQRTQHFSGLGTADNDDVLRQVAVGHAPRVGTQAGHEPVQRTCAGHDEQSRRCQESRTGADHRHNGPAQEDAGDDAGFTRDQQQGHERGALADGEVWEHGLSFEK